MKSTKSKAKPKTEAKAETPAEKPAQRAEPLKVRIVEGNPPGPMPDPSAPPKVATHSQAEHKRGPHPDAGVTPGQPTSDRVPGEIKEDETAHINGGPIPPRVGHQANQPERVYEKRTGV